MLSFPDFLLAVGEISRVLHSRGLDETMLEVK